jgi:hypothetical protein
MNLAQSLGAAAAALVMGLSAGGVAPAQTMSRITAEVHERLTPGAIRGAVEELAAMLEQRYVFPDVAERYAEHLRDRAAAGAYDGVDDPQQLAAQLTGELNSIHRDAHLRVTLSGGSEPGRRVLHAPPGDDAFGQAQWLADGVAYLRINMLPGDEGSESRMAQILDRYADADVLVLDLRTCRGGTLGVMDVLLSRLYARPTQLVTMDTRAGADADLEDFYGATTTMREITDAPPNVRRWQHWAQPTSPVNSLADARVFVLTDETASACEHLSISLKETGRATLVGATTRGAGHYGADRVFGNGTFQAFVPVGRTYIARTGQGWEGVGIAHAPLRPRHGRPCGEHGFDRSARSCGGLCRVAKRHPARRPHFEHQWPRRARHSGRRSAPTHALVAADAHGRSWRPAFDLQHVARRLIESP